MRKFKLLHIFHPIFSDLMYFLGLVKNRLEGEMVILRVSFITTDNTNNNNNLRHHLGGTLDPLYALLDCKGRKRNTVRYFVSLFCNNYRLYFQVCDGALLSETNKRK